MQVDAGRERRLTLHGVDFHVTEYASDGVGPPLMCLHGGMAHSRFFDFLAPLLGTHARPFAVDRRGHGASDWAEPGSYNTGQDIADTEEICRAISPEPWVLVGHSQGGIYSVPLAQRGRLPLLALVLLDIPFDPLAPALQRTGRRLRRVPQIRYPDAEVAQRGFQPYPLPHRASEAACEYLAEHSFRPEEDGSWVSRFHWARMRQERDPSGDLLGDFPERYAELDLPVLVVRGGDSSILPRAEFDDMVARLPRGRGVEIPDTTHSLHLEEPAAVAQAINEFLAALTTAGAV